MKKKMNPVLRELLSWVEILGLACLIAFFVNKCLIVNAEVLSGSMENTMYKDNRVMGSRLSYVLSDVERGDIVVFDCPYEHELNPNAKSYIKRVIGLPGDVIEIKNSKIYINGSDTPLDEPYLKEEWTVSNDGLTYVVPENCYFMLGDNRNISSDSRYWAEKAYMYGLCDSVQTGESYRYVPKENLIGKVYVKYWPLTEFSWLE